MRIKTVIEMNTDTGEFTTQFFNLSNPGEGIEYHTINDILKKIFKDVDKQIGTAPLDDEQVLKMVH